MALVYADTAKVAEDPEWMATTKKRVLLGALIRSCAASPVHPEGLQQSVLSVLNST
jgi:hypothetical protein